MARMHPHQCQTCGKNYECDGTLFENYDGAPEVACQTYHVTGLQVCEDCFEREQRELSTEESAQAIGEAAQRAIDRVEAKQ